METGQRSKNKVVLIGDFGVGKTTLFMRFKTGNYVENHGVKRDEAEHCKIWTKNGKERCLTLYDTAGMERFDSTVPPTYFRHAKAVIFVYAIDNQESIGDVIHWAESITPQRLGAQSAELICVLVGNKVDEEKTREVSTKRAMDTAEKCGFDKDMVFEISAKTGHGVEEMFDAIANRLIALGQESQIPQLTPVPSKKGTGGCCS